MSNLKLYGQTQNDISLKDALKKYEASLKDAIGLFYSPQSCQFCRLIEGQISNLFFKDHSWEETDCKLDNIFEARFFNANSELRWLHKSNKKGRAILLSEKLLNFKDESKPQTLTYVDSIHQTYLIWGKSTQERPENWSILSSARIGQLAVPLKSDSSREYVLLHSKEYIGIAPQDKSGNVTVLQERLLSLSWEGKNDQKY
jgi:CRISPR-associated protein (TIGR03984 family)